MATYKLALLRALITHFSGQGGLSGFARDYRDQRLGGSAAALADTAFNAIANTIVVGPVHYAGGALDNEERFFSFRGRRTARGKCSTAAGLETFLGEILVPALVWKEMCLIGYWVSESIVLRWAELTADMAEKRVQPAEVVERLLVRPDAEREVIIARKAYAGLDDLRCVWTGRPIRAFDVDHLIPFSLWFNNDLWNLLPAARSVNLAKKDKLVSRRTLLGSRQLIIHYWRFRGATGRLRPSPAFRRRSRRSRCNAGWSAGRRDVKCSLSVRWFTGSEHRGIFRLW